MARLGAICVTLACVLVLVDCWRRDDACEELVTCQTPLYDYFDHSTETPSYDFSVLSGEDLEEFCRKEIIAYDCVRPFIDDCSSDEVVVKAKHLETKSYNLCEAAYNAGRAL